MQGLYTRLVVTTVIVFTLVFLVFQQTKKQELPPNSVQFFPVGEVYGVIPLTTDGQFNLPSFLDDYGDFKAQSQLIQERLTTAGLLLDRLFVVGQLNKKQWSFFLRVKDAKRVLNELDDWAFFLDWKTEKKEDSRIRVYQDTLNNYRLEVNGQFLAFHYNYQSPDSTLTHPIDLQQWMDGPPQFIVAPAWLEELSIYPIVLHGSFEGKTIRLQGNIKSAQEFPFNLGNAALKMDTAQGVQQWLSINIAPKKLLESSRYMTKLATTAKKIGFPALPVLAHWDGALTLQRGGEFSYTDTIITTEFDDDFNELEQRVFRKRKVKAFELLMTSKAPDSLFHVLQSNGFLSRQGRRYFLPSSPPLNVNRGENSLRLSTQLGKQPLERDNSMLYLAQWGWITEAFMFNGYLLPVNKRQLKLDLQLEIRDITKMNLPIPQ